MACLARTRWNLSVASARLDVRAWRIRQGCGRQPARWGKDPGPVSHRDEVQGCQELGVRKPDDGAPRANRCRYRDRSRQVAGLAWKRPTIRFPHQSPGRHAAGKEGYEHSTLFWNLRRLYFYIEHNAGTLVNYGTRYHKGLPISSSIAESAVNLVVSFSHRMA